MEKSISIVLLVGLENDVYQELSPQLTRIHRAP